VNDYYQFRDETGTPIDYYQLVNDNNELCKEIERLNNIINKLEKELFGMYVDIARWNEDYAKKRIEKLKEGGDSENL
jgi:DNA gyrase/topoisomerase IV subunit A